ncbi:MAG: hypothetical protein KF753_19440 [Caldilineaceae bacterium]|nr:hypothetical protein [Caldilineaceae bacterium]
MGNLQTERGAKETKATVAEEKIKAGLLDDILARIDAEYANYKQTPVFTCQEEELAYWSRQAPSDSAEPSNETDTQTENKSPSSQQPGQ